MWGVLFDQAQSIRKPKAKPSRGCVRTHVKIFMGKFVVQRHIVFCASHAQIVCVPASLSRVVQVFFSCLAACVANLCVYPHDRSHYMWFVCVYTYIKDANVHSYIHTLGCLCMMFTLIIDVRMRNMCVYIYIFVQMRVGG